MADPKILFVDDEVSVLRALQRACIDQSWDIQVASSAAQALEMLHAQRFAVIVSDMRMPEMDGATLLAQVAEAFPLTVRMLLTGFSDDDDTAKAVNEGKIFNYLHKPWDNDQLITSIQLGLKYRQTELDRRVLQKKIYEQNLQLKLVNEQLERKVRQRTAEVENALRILKENNEHLENQLQATIEVLNNVVEMREEHAAGHSRRIAEYAVALGKLSNMDEGEIKQLRMAALLHDIGTLGLSDEILYKAYDQMAKSERMLYQQHPILGQAILLKDEDLALAGVFIRQHHEFLDGSGYPDHLRGDEIELGARIISLCSDFDSYVCGRLEDGLFNQEQGVEFIQAHAGSRYDIELVQLFVDLIQEHQFSDAEQSSVVSINELQEKMILARDLKTDTGIILLSQGTELTMDKIQTIKRFESEVDHHLVIHILAQ